MRVRIDDRAAAVLFTAKRNSYAVFRARRTGEKGALIEFTVKPGDRVLISKYGGTEIKLDGEDYLILSENDILAIIG